ncbi:hypothetical protein [Microbacterium sp. SLBN-146]|uniref:hypothetical protein n=1 Tax=Microbacterium sp. SLBN-146 TaxID=2768457 RepID=UPI0011506C9C|nr:hypothetical protein [Microbacterium sp. SLBN-146]TQJ31545.1 hypothetical protein FBY39_2022 [Microbacterium sp. SLBN-146]
MSTDDRQRIVRVAGSRRVKLTPAPGTEPEPTLDTEERDAAGPGGTVKGPNDDQLRADVPPHY